MIKHFVSLESVRYQVVKRSTVTSSIFKIIQTLNINVTINLSKLQHDDNKFHRFDFAGAVSWRFEVEYIARMFVKLFFEVKFCPCER